MHNGNAIVRFYALERRFGSYNTKLPYIRPCSIRLERTMK